MTTRDDITRDLFDATAVLRELQTADGGHLDVPEYRSAARRAGHAALALTAHDEDRAMTNARRHELERAYLDAVAVIQELHLSIDSRTDEALTGLAWEAALRVRRAGNALAALDRAETTDHTPRGPKHRGTT